MKVVVAAFNQEKALVGAFSVIVKTDGSFAALQIADTSRVDKVDIATLLATCENINWWKKNLFLFLPLNEMTGISVATQINIFWSSDGAIFIL